MSSTRNEHHTYPPNSFEDRVDDTEIDSGPREECGVFGVWAPGEDVAKLTYYGLYALQHRGQEAAGIAVSDGRRTVVFKDLGLVSQVFDEQVLSSLRGHLAVGHVRYSTTGSTTWENAQPTFRTTATGSGIATAVVDHTPFGKDPSQPFHFDLDAAKKLMAESKSPKGLDLELLTDPSPRLSKRMKQSSSSVSARMSSV